jgi:hypothetical protein
MAPVILTAVQGGICALIKTKCCVHIPDNSASVSEVLKDVHTPANTMPDPKMNFGDLPSSWFAVFTWWKGINVHQHHHNNRHLALLLPGQLC